LRLIDFVRAAAHKQCAAMAQEKQGRAGKRRNAIPRRNGGLWLSRLWRT